MGEKSTIEWTNATWPIVQGCNYESPACTNCYAVPLLWRLAHNPNPKVSGPLQGLVAKSSNGKLHFTGRVELRHDRLRDPIDWKKPRMIFVPSHGDIFHKDVPDAFLHRIFATMACTPRHTYQVLTKRPARALEYLTALGKSIAPLEAAARDVGYTFKFEGIPLLSWPLPNVWLGISAEDQGWFDYRWRFLRDTPAALRFLSYEPALGPLDPTRDQSKAKLGWAICGLESGAGTRPRSITLLRDFTRACQRAGVPVFVKQFGSKPLDAPPSVTGKGREMDEWPEDLRVRQFPTTTSKKDAA